MSDRHTFLLRLSGEVCTKGRPTRQRFTDRIAEAIEDALATAGHTFTLQRTWSRLFVRSDSAESGAVLQRIFGLQSVSAAREHRWTDLDDIVAAGREVFAPQVVGRRFAVRARRTTGHPRLPFDSPQIERALGAALVDGSDGVDLERPQFTAGVEVHTDRVYFYGDRLAGTAGLPMGVEGRALALVSGGFDSAVAAWQIWKRGTALDFVFFNLGGRQHEAGAVAVTERLARRWAYADWPRLFAVDLRPLLERLQEEVKPKYWQLTLKGLMLLAADRLADELRLPALVTGEAMGQVSSQTLPNLALLDRVMPRLVLRPLLTGNKDDIVAAARRIGTYELSAEVPEFCALAARHAVTSGHAGEFSAALATLDRQAIAEAVASATEREARMPEPIEKVAGAIEPQALPAHIQERSATVLDLRSAADYASWHWPESLHLEYPQALRAYRSLDRDLAYVVYCEVGLKSAHLAELMQAAGLKVRHVPLGTRGLRRVAAAGTGAASC